MCFVYFYIRKITSFSFRLFQGAMNTTAKERVDWSLCESGCIKLEMNIHIHVAKANTGALPPVALSPNLLGPRPSSFAGGGRIIVQDVAPPSPPMPERDCWLSESNLGQSSEPRNKQ